MINARIVYINDMHEAREEIRKIGVDASAITWLSPKALSIAIKLEDVSTFEANIIKQEMLGKGGDAAVNRGVASFSTESSDILLMGTYSQYNRLVYKLRMQGGSLKEIANEIQRLLEGLEKGKPEYFECGKYKLPIDEKTYVMGILNVTPDSFSDGGQYIKIDSAIKRAKEMVDAGADIIDVGGESTRPGYQQVDALEEINRVVPIIESLSKELNVPISVDTSKALVAEKALCAGACIVNDVWGLQKDPAMAEVVSKHGAGVIMMHNSDTKEYRDLMGDIIRFLRKSIEIAEKVGITRENMVVDPGIGFGKTLEHNLEVMRRMRELNTLNLPVLLGTSRKSLIGNVLDLPVNERLEGTAATITLGIANGADIVRVHDVKEMVRVVRMTDAMVRV
ncbi:dihydropteroate synthase [Acetivibrio mesophilus]|uniref:Dihydropteroate synthase n=1 Tax=Acetivibrio mesophilus TaxID=2487273 RepID=A0A4Q0I2L8_9FIRM|nr:dihydropteroate synthase [Acetivibrio mesophilus]RXE57957.1 dihydropteroate synthase [Acetivibrio mesophilus]HHV28989.1 dihydropteroate synthase [Clostridium sp.]